MVLTAKNGTVDDPASADAAGLELTDELAREKYISFAASYWTLRSPLPH